MKTILFTALMAASLGSVALPARCGAVVVREAPPAARAERVPPPRRGHVWAPGHWEWKNRHHVWAPGKWLRERRGYVYKAPDWEERGGSWRLRNGNWVYAERGTHGGVRKLDDASAFTSR